MYPRAVITLLFGVAIAHSILSLAYNGIISKAFIEERGVLKCCSTLKQHTDLMNAMRETSQVKTI